MISGCLRWLGFVERGLRTLMLERSTVSRNLALMQDRGWVAVAETSATGRAMAVSITDAGLAAFTGASTAWRGAQADAARMLGPDAAPILDQWLGLDAATPASGSDGVRRLSRQRGGSGTGSAPHAPRINAGRGTELAPVLPAELGRIVVSDAVPDAGDVVRAVR
jgi:hypothetical protein